MRQVVHDEETGRLCCHLCGGFFLSLGSHLRRHGWTADAYRRAMGLSRTRPLTARSLSATISARQAQRYTEEPALREVFSTGQEMARNGVLSERARSGKLATAPETRRAREDALERGRATAAGLGHARVLH
ncbi:hypothetical protein BH23ACT9_BH23ACT9_30660 [soil metagenome]